MIWSGKVLLFAFLLISSVIISDAQNVERKSDRLQMQVIQIQETNPTEYIFTINQVVGFKSIDSLKKFIANFPEGTILEWAPGCSQFGDTPLLSSEKELSDFRAYCESKKIKFVLVPAG